MSGKLDSIKRICVMCGQKHKEGIMIHSGFICDDCQYEIVHTDVSDKKYPIFIQRLKDLWLKNA